MILQNMQREIFMQLLIILALLLYDGKSGTQNLLSEVKPVLESIGGEQMREALKSAEEISTVLSAVSELTGAAKQTQPSETQSEFSAFANLFGSGGNASPVSTSTEAANTSPIAFPLKPICNVADKDITYSLSKYITNA